MLAKFLCYLTLCNQYVVNSTWPGDVKIGVSPDNMLLPKPVFTESNFEANAHPTILYNEFEKYT